MDVLFPVWKISEIALDNDLSFPRAFTFDVPQGYTSKAEMVWATLDVFTQLFPNSALPLIHNSCSDGRDRQS